MSYTPWNKEIWEKIGRLGLDVPEELNYSILDMPRYELTEEEEYKIYKDLFMISKDDAPDGFDFINKYNRVSISQYTQNMNIPGAVKIDLKRFSLKFSNSGSEEKGMTVVYDVLEKEKIELYLISNPNVKYVDKMASMMQAYHRFNEDCTPGEAEWIRGYCDRHGIDRKRYQFDRDEDELF